MCQSLAYKAIRSREMKHEYKKRRRTELNVQVAKAEVLVLSGAEPSEESLWKAIRHKDISREPRCFLWMTFHDAYMVGSNWLRLGLPLNIRKEASVRNVIDLKLRVWNTYCRM